MCGRFALNDDVNELIEEFVAKGGKPEDWRPSWNIKPTQDIMVLFETENDGTMTRRAEYGRWSLVPSWSPNLHLRYPTFNARIEEAAAKPTWKPSVPSKRALIPASGYYEWKTNGKTKTPYYIHSAGDELIMFAGLYSWWPDPTLAKDDDTRWHLTATILTTDAVKNLAHIHDRNPVPLPEDWWDHWIDPTIAGDQKLLDDATRAATPIADALTYHEVAPLKGDGPELVTPVAHRK